MKKQSGKRNKRNLYGILLVLFMLAVAFFLPELYFSYYDRANWNQVEYLSAQVDTYQIQYEDFGKKLAALGEYYAKGTALQAVLLQEMTDSETQGKLTESVNREFQEILSLYPRESGFLFLCYSSDMKSCGLYTVYPEESGSEQRRGFTFWRIVYAYDEDFEICVLLDAEFEKIVSVAVSGNWLTAYEHKNTSKAENHSTDGGLLYEWNYLWTDIMCRYYGLYDEVDFWPESEAAIVSEENGEKSGSQKNLSERGVFYFYTNTEGSYLILESYDYYVYGTEEKEYYVMGFSCLNDFLQL